MTIFVSFQRSDSSVAERETCYITELGGREKRFLCNIGLAWTRSYTSACIWHWRSTFLWIAVLNRGSCRINDTLLDLRFVHFHTHRQNVMRICSCSIYVHTNDRMGTKRCKLRSKNQKSLSYAFTFPFRKII